MKISIIIAGFNCKNTIKETLESCIHAIKNSNVCDEIIYYDDGSTDGSINIVQDFSDNLDIDVHLVILQGPNKGVSFARNSAIQAASNELIAVIDSDDLMSQSRLEDQHSIFLNNPEVSFISGGCVVAWGMYLTIYKPPKKQLEKKDLFFNPVINPTVTFRKAKFLELGGYNVTQSYGEDLDLSYRALQNGFKFVMAENIWCTYRERQSPKKLVASFGVLKIHCKNFNRVHLAILFFLLDILILLGLYKPRSWIK